MINISKALKSNRILKSLTGLSIEKFKELVPYFESIIKEEQGKRVQNDRNRQRKQVVGQNQYWIVVKPNFSIYCSM